MIQQARGCEEILLSFTKARKKEKGETKSI
jgi:hypothetical protein